MIFRKRREPDLDAILREVTRGRRDKADIIRDFKAVFFRDEQSRRVLNELLHWTRILKPVRGTDPHDTYFREGERNIGLKLLLVLNAEPDPPSKEHS